MEAKERMKLIRVVGMFSDDLYNPSKTTELLKCVGMVNGAYDDKINGIMDALYVVRSLGAELRDAIYGDYMDNIQNNETTKTPHEKALEAIEKK